MALLHFLNFMLFGLERKSKMDASFVTLVKDMDKFNKYP